MPRKSSSKGAQLTFETSPTETSHTEDTTTPMEEEVGGGGGDEDHTHTHTTTQKQGEINKALEPMMSAFKMCGPRKSIAPPASDTQSNEGATFYAICPSDIPRYSQPTL